MRNFLLKDHKGHALLQFLIIMPLLYLIIFIPINLTFAQHKRNVLNDVLDMALQKAAIEGGVNAVVRQQILTDLHDRGFKPDDVIIEPAVYTEYLRGELIELSISVPGGASSLKGVEAIGGTPPPDDWRITASGSIMSEKLP